MGTKLAIGALCIFGLGVYGFGAFDTKQHPMTSETAIGYRGDTYAPSDDDIAAVVEAWGEPIPVHLELVGGPAEWGWTAMRYETDGDILRFFGEFRNWRYRYKGEFLLFGGKAELTAENIFSEYHMSSMDSDAIIFSQTRGTPPLDYFRLRAKDLNQIEDSLKSND